MFNKVKKYFSEEGKSIRKEMAEASFLYDERKYDKIKWCFSCKKCHLSKYNNCPICNNTLSSIEDKFRVEEHMKQYNKERDEYFRQEAEKEMRLKQSGYHGMAECPYCHSRDTRKISTTSKVTSVAMLGIASNKIGKQWHCNNCKSDF